MPFKIFNEGNVVHTANTLTETANYMEEHHTEKKGFSLSTLNRRKIREIGDTYSKGDIIIEKVYGDNSRKMIKSLRPENINTIIDNFNNMETISFKNDVIITQENQYHLINKIRNKIIEKNLTYMNRRKFKITIITKNTKTQLNMGTTYLSFNLVMKDITDKIEYTLLQYDFQMVIEKIVIDTFLQNKNLGEQVIYGNKKNTVKIMDIVSTMDLIGEMVLNEKATKKLLKLLKENKVCSPSTNKNCLIKACYIAKYCREDIKNAVDNFIMRNRAKITNYNCDILCPILSKTLKRKINVHFIDYEITTLTYQSNKKYEEEIDIVIHGSHAIALIKRKPDDIINIEEKEQELIETPEYGNDGETKIATFDMETCDLDEVKQENKDNKKHNTIPYAIGFYDGDIYKEFYMRNRDDDITKRFIKWLFYTYKQRKIIIYSHNGGKFDIYLLLNTILKQKGIIITSFLEQSGRIINLKLNSKEKQIIFRDSINLIAGSLDNACKSFDPPTKKLEGDVIHEKINMNNCHSEGELIEIGNEKISVYDYTSNYLKNDCKSLHEILIIFDNIIIEKYEMSIRNVITNASIARRLYLSNFYNTEDTPLYRLTPEVDRELRKYYYGGRNEVFTYKGHTKGKLYYLDFTSLYPYIMSKYKIQYGKMNIINVEDKTKFDKKWFGFIQCRFRHKKKNKIPLHAVIKDNKLVFPYCDTWQDAIVSSEEIRYSIKNRLGYEYEFIKVYNYENKRTHFKPIIDELYKMKIDAQEEGNEALRSIAKIIINSMYGFFGINYLKRDQTKIIRERDSKLKVGITKAQSKTEAKIYSYLSKQQLKEYKKVAGYDVYQINAPIKPGCANVGIASMITSYSRMELYKLMNDLKNKGGNLYYCDTDSIVTDYNIYDDDELCKKWIRSGGKKLGELTNETDQKGGYYKEIITLGNKMYALRNEELIKEKKRIIIKMKGINSKMKYNKKEIDHDNKTIKLIGQNKFDGKEKITFDDYKLIAKGYKLTCDNMNFISGIRDMIYKGNKLIKLNNTKTIKSLYDKADVDDYNNIKPLII